MVHTAVIIFTARNRRMILQDRGSRDWRIYVDRVRRSGFLACT